MSCINILREDILTIHRIEDTDVREIGDVIEYLGDTFLVYSITDVSVRAVKVVDKRTKK
ncbi:hypothetical protein ACTFR8_22970 [Bacillus cereus group sp. MYBK15-3]|uniref:hypothetical protein n=1 Tax=Bacillus cereus group TaxID=86661 RepID=UPI001C8B38B0|nr:hypothetical protein [Bacillus cereus]MBX9158461.1 hypothetical protein [Bacillus cereus]